MRIINWFSKNFRYYVVFSKEALFILGLIFVHSFVEKALLDILITHLQGVWGIHKSAQAVNLQEGTAAVLQILFAFALDAYLGRFKMGLVLFWNADWHSDIRTFYIGLVLITLAKAAKEVSLKAFLDDQFMAKDIPTTEKEKERQHSRSNVWWRSASILGSIAAIFVPSSLKLLSMISAIAMMIAYLWLWLGAKFYECNRPTGSAISDVLFVIRTAVRKSDLPYATTPEQLFQNYKGVTRIEPCISWLMWLDKAPIMIEEVNRPDKNCTVAQVKEVKFLLALIPMWTTFLTYSLVDATGSTFFFVQVSNIDDKFPVTVFVILVTVTISAIDYLCDFLFQKIGNEMNGQLIRRGRIGVGMAFSVICCIFAWKNAVHWLYLVKIYTKPSLHINIFSLTPQFIFLGIMKGFSEGGLQSFFCSQVSESLKNYGPPFGECVIGIGKFLSMFCILIFGRWFGKYINFSRLDNYYALLTLLSFVNLLIYCLVAYWYGDVRFSPEVDCEPLIEGAQDSIRPLVLPSFSDQMPNNLQYIGVSTRRTRSLSDKMPNISPYFSVFRRGTWSFPSPAQPTNPNRLDYAHEKENEQLLNLKISDSKHRDVL
ncbi:protein NRT1/ PTR FAMILY 5.6-like isoform X2 [Olea europaea var. sylvestris]|uniref:protein NRT1/ PTR FAMILY 5.6-like isoform X2 n=1 Tax=Olea europaea var. sylvestris TaxID=158386 RepID=UPI000C1D8116|nr:protein NRT1/ PTR FAMILY 5.6-like isoform X2 [Olea europaea var. sylvestris]